MQDLVNNIPNIKDSTRDTHRNRLNTIMNKLGVNDIFFIFSHPKESYSKLLVIHKNDAYLANLFSSVCKVLSSSTSLPPKYKLFYDDWRGFMMKHSKIVQDNYSNSNLNEDKLSSIVHWDQIQDMFCKLKNSRDTFTDFNIHMNFMVLAVMLFIHPKRADLGNVYILNQKPTDATFNYIVLTPNGVSFLAMNSYKTAKVYKEIIEDLDIEFVNILIRSLHAFPRKFLFGFILNKLFVPYELNNSYGHFVRRAFLTLFGKAQGVSLWRHVYIRERIDFNMMSHKELRKKARLMCHSIGQQLSVYKFINNHNEPHVFSNDPVTCSKK